MAKLVYAAMTSLDGYIEDTAGSFSWAMPDEQVHAFANDLDRSIGTFLYGRRLYETMKVWEDMYGQDDEPPVVQDYAEVWHTTDKVVFSKTLDRTTTARTRIERTFDPEIIRRMKEESAQNLSVGGAELAGQALTAGLVDEIHLLVSPVIVGGGKPALPETGETRLELLEQRAFGNGVVHLHYAVKS